MVTVGGIKIDCRNWSSQSWCAPAAHGSIPLEKPASIWLTGIMARFVSLINLQGGNKNISRENYIFSGLCSAFTGVSNVMFEIHCWWNHLSLNKHYSRGGLVRVVMYFAMINTNTAQVPPTTSHPPHHSPICLLGLPGWLRRKFLFASLLTKL